MSPQITVSRYVKKELEKIKEEREHKSFDSVIRDLLASDRLLHKEGEDDEEQGNEKVR